MWQAALVLGVVGCAASVAKAPRSDARPTATIAGKILGVPGEVMEYQVDLRGVTIGKVQVAVGNPGWVSGERAIIVRSHGATAGVLSWLGELRWELTTTLALDTGDVIDDVEESWETFGGKTRHHRETGDHNNDLHAAAARLRAWRSQVGDATSLDTTIDSGGIGVELHDAARELLGGRPAVRYDGIALDEYAFRLWISDDAARVPLRVQAASKWGEIVIDLVRYDLPSDL